jgi:hypothetical protein
MSFSMEKTHFSIFLKHNLAEHHELWFSVLNIKIIITIIIMS